MDLDFTVHFNEEDRWILIVAKSTFQANNTE